MCWRHGYSQHGTSPRGAGAVWGPITRAAPAGCWLISLTGRTGGVPSWW
jgi:hypothetical protein